MNQTVPLLIFEEMCFWTYTCACSSVSLLFKSYNIFYSEIHIDKVYTEDGDRYNICSDRPLISSFLSSQSTVLAPHEPLPLSLRTAVTLRVLSCFLFSSSFLSNVYFLSSTNNLILSYTDDLKLYSSTVKSTLSYLPRATACLIKT